MNNIAGFIAFMIIASSSTYGQEIIKPIDPNFSNYFNGIPIDSCFEDISKQTKEGNKSVKISSIDSSYKSIKYKVLNPKIESEADSIRIYIYQGSTGIGGTNQKAGPVVYEHWATKAFYFNDSLIATKSFKRLKSELDSLELRFSRFEEKKADKLEIIYPLKTGKNKNLTTFQITLSIIRNKDLVIVELNHRKIYRIQMCN
jgi:hypothetical protein